MKGQGKGWKGESRRHSMARKGVSTNNNIKMNESSGMLFESKGSILDVVSLFKMVGFGDILGTQEAKGYTKEEYELDANNVMVYPSGDAEKSIDWMLVEYAEGNQARKNQIKKLLRLAVKQIESRIGQVDNVDVRIELHKSRKLFKEAMDGLKTKLPAEPPLRSVHDVYEEAKEKRKASGITKVFSTAKTEREADIILSKLDKMNIGGEARWYSEEGLWKIFIDKDKEVDILEFNKTIWELRE